MNFLMRWRKTGDLSPASLHDVSHRRVANKVPLLTIDYLADAFTTPQRRPKFRPFATAKFMLSA